MKFEEFDEPFWQVIFGFKFGQDGSVKNKNKEKDQGNIPNMTNSLAPKEQTKLFIHLHLELVRSLVLHPLFVTYEFKD